MRRVWQQASTVALALTVLGVALYGPNAIHGGFLSDAWSNRAIYVFAPQGTLDGFLVQSNIQARPFYAVYLVALNALFGSNMGFWLAWLVATHVLMALALYLLLRELDVSVFDAAMIGSLVLLFPASSSLGLWAAVVHIPVAIGLAALGFLLALRAFSESGRRGIALHCGSLACFLASVLFYEAAIGLMLASILLYGVRASWQAAAKRWALDVVLLVSLVGCLAALSPTAKEIQDVAGTWAHAAEIFDQAWILLGTSILPLASTRWYVLALLGLPPLVAMLLLRRLSPLDPARIELRRWLNVLGAGTLIVVLGYAVFVPGIDYYMPLGQGIANRVNAVPGIGFVLILYALIALTATIVLRGLSDTRRPSLMLTGLACALIGVGWGAQINRDSDNYTAAFREGERLRSVVAKAISEPAPNSVIWTFGQPVEMAPGIPVFGNTWDMTSAVQLLYDDPSIRSLVGFSGTTFECRPDAIVPGGHPEYTTSEPATRATLDSLYGRTYFVDTLSGRAELIQTPRACRAAAGEFPRSPYLPGEPVAPAR